MSPAFVAATRSVLEQTMLADRLERSGAIAVERIARSGGAIEMFRFGRGTTIAELESLFRPGSIVSFYFDKRFHTVDAANADTISGPFPLLMAFAQGPEKPRLCVTNDVSGAQDMSEFMEKVPGNAEVIYGPFPEPDNDGARAITLTIPDRDGVVRSHPH